MIFHSEGDMLKLHRAGLICHQVNCMGKMGAGIAKQIKHEYPIVEREYSSICRQYSQCRDKLLGQVLYTKVSDNLAIANIFGQLDYRRFGENGKIYTDYNALRAGLEKINSDYNNTFIGIPFMIGCGLGGGKWVDVYNIIQDIFIDSSNYLIIYRLKD